METSTKTTSELKLEKARKMYIELHIHKGIRRDRVLEKICKELFYTMERLKRLLPIAEFKEIEKKYLESKNRAEKNPK